MARSFREACLETGRVEEGLSAVRKGLAEVEETEARVSEAELNRLEGDLLLASKEPDEKRAAASFRKAIAVARRQLAKVTPMSGLTGIWIRPSMSYSTGSSVVMILSSIRLRWLSVA